MRISDWSLYVCSSDLVGEVGAIDHGFIHGGTGNVCTSEIGLAQVGTMQVGIAQVGAAHVGKAEVGDVEVGTFKVGIHELAAGGIKQIGRASCRERVCQDG